MFTSPTEHVLESLRKELSEQINDVENLLHDFLSTPFWRFRRRKMIFKRLEESRNLMLETAENLSFLTHCIYGD